MKRIFLVLSLLGLVALPAFPQDFNVLIIHVDDLGWADIEPLGSDFYETPHINRLASEGILFTNSYAAAAICSPTRAAMLTGKYPARLGITDWIRAKFQGVTTSGLPGEYEVFEDKPLKTPKIQGFLPLEEVTIAERMKSYGYETLHVGKWHLGEEGFYPTDQGFDVNIGGNDLGQPPSYFDPYLPAQPRQFYEITTLKPRKEGEFLTDREGDEVVDYIQSKKEKKFFIHWAPYAVHTPIMGKPDMVEKYKQKEPGNQRNPEYAALVESVDQNVGKVIEALDELGLREKTLVIFTSDNGGLIWDYENPITNNYPLKSQKGYPYEGGIRVPTIVSWPGKLPMGALSESPIITMDWIPTILDFMGENPVQEGLEGISLKPILENPSQKVDRDLFWHFPHYRLNDIVPYAIVRSGDYKLIHYFDGSQDELYNLDFDMEEKVNVISTRKAIADQLQIKLEKWLEETGARLPVEK